jgi:hypothetical protein
MKRKTLFGLIVLGLWAVLGFAAQTQVVPSAVSPGSERGLAVVGQACPTFSWTAVDWALGYRVAVFQAFGTAVPGYEEMAVGGVPVLSKEIAGRASSWTPSSDERLSPGSLYVWYVQAMDSSGQGVWSKGKLFMVEAGGWTSGLEVRVRQMLKEKGIRDEVIDKLLQETSTGLQSGVLTGSVPGSGGKTQGDVGIQGSEGPTNTFYGQYAGANTTGTHNTFMGAYAGYSNTTGYYNTFMGANAGLNNTTGTYNTFIGLNAGVSNTVGYYDTFIGNGAGYANTSGDSNTFLGLQAGFNNTTGYNNTFLGRQAGLLNTTGYNNVFIGPWVGYANTTGYADIFIGKEAGFANTTGSFNTFLGNWAGFHNTTGYQNTFLGSEAGWSTTTGKNNVFIGMNAGAFETGSYKLYINDDAGSNPLIYGDFNSDYLRFNGNVGIGIVPTYPLDVSGGAYCSGTTWVNASSREYKENIETLTSEEALAAFQELAPVKFNYKADKEEKYLGFIAEEVPELVAMKDRKGLNPMDIVAVLTKVVQEQQKTIFELKERMGKLEKKGKVGK